MTSMEEKEVGYHRKELTGSSSLGVHAAAAAALPALRLSGSPPCFLTPLPPPNLRDVMPGDGSRSFIYVVFRYVSFLAGAVRTQEFVSAFPALVFS